MARRSGHGETITIQQFERARESVASRVAEDLPTLPSPALIPLPLDEIRNDLKNARSATLDLDSVYDLPAARDRDKMVIGKASATGSPNPPFSRPQYPALARSFTRPRSAGSSSETSSIPSSLG